MQKNNVVDWEREITQEGLLEILRQVNRPLFTLRQLTELRSEGLLPPLQRRSCPGSKKAVYVWERAVIEQATFLYDLLQWNNNHRWVVLPLWLRGYPVDFSPIRQRWLQSIDAYLRTFTHGTPEESFPDDGPEDHVSRTIERLKERWKHTPTAYRPEPLQQYGIEAYAQFSEILWGMLLVEEYEVDETTFAAILAIFQGTNASTNTVPLQETIMDGGISWVKMLQEILAIPQLREAIEQATPDEWEKARRDYLTLCQFCQAFFASLQGNLEGVFRGLFFAASGFYLVPVALAIRRAGYRHWIDDAFAWVSEQLADPITQMWLERIADPEIQALLTTPEGQAQLIEQLPRLRAAWIGEESQSQE